MTAFYREAAEPRWSQYETPCGDRGTTVLKRHPEFVHGRKYMSCLIHRVARVEARWYTCHLSSGQRLDRLVSPILIAETICGMSFRVGEGGTLCEIPAGESIHCGKCNGQVATFGKHSTKAVSRRTARKKLGCIMAGF